MGHYPMGFFLFPWGNASGGTSPLPLFRGRGICRSGRPGNGEIIFRSGKITFKEICEEDYSSVLLFGSWSLVYAVLLSAWGKSWLDCMFGDIAWLHISLTVLHTMKIQLL